MSKRINAEAFENAVKGFIDGEIKGGIIIMANDNNQVVGGTFGNGLGMDLVWGILVAMNQNDELRDFIADAIAIYPDLQAKLAKEPSDTISLKKVRAIFEKLVEDAKRD